MDWVYGSDKHILDLEVAEVPTEWLRLIPPHKGGGRCKLGTGYRYAICDCVTSIHLTRSGASLGISHPSIPHFYSSLHPI